MAAPRGAALGIGRLLSLEVLDPRTGRTRKRTLRGKWLVWIPGKRRFAIGTLRGRAAGRLPAAVAKAHQRFHGAGSRSVSLIDVPEASGRLQQLGLVKALVYDVPRSITSPGKNPYHWHHAFGDTGHQGGSDYPTKVMPALVTDRAGNLFIRRRPGNIFTVDTWLRG